MPLCAHQSGSILGRFTLSCEQDTQCQKFEFKMRVPSHIARGGWWLYEDFYPSWVDAVKE